MDKHLLHNIIHRDAGNNSAACPVCNGTISMNDSQSLSARAEEAMKRNQQNGMMYAELDSKSRSSLDNASFAYIDSKGGKHLPIPDADHVRNALARFDQTKFESEEAKKKAMTKILAAARKFGVKADPDKDGDNDADPKKDTDHDKGKKAYELHPFIDVMAFSEGDDVLPERIKLVPVGEFNTQKYGPITISKDDVAEMKKNFDAQVRAGVMIDIDHDGGEAAGWIKQVEASDDGLWGVVDWTQLGKDKLTSRQYRFLSPEFDQAYKDPEQSQEFGNVLLAASLVNRPLFQKSLQPLVASEGAQNTNLTGNLKGLMLFIDQVSGPITMNITEILAKAKSERTSEEQAFLVEHQAELTPEQKVAEGFVAQPETPTTPVEENKEETPVEGKEGTVAVKASEWNEMKKQVAMAAKERRMSELKVEISKFTFSDRGGKVPPAMTDQLVTFMLDLNETQAKQFTEILNKLPDRKVFGEIGSDANVTNSQVADTIDAEVQKIMADEKISYSAAITKLQLKNPSMFNEYLKNMGLTNKAQGAVN